MNTLLVSDPPPCWLSRPTPVCGCLTYDFPVCIVQLPDFGAPPADPAGEGPENFPVTREQQLKYLPIPNTGVLLVSSPDVPVPVALRYAFSMNPDGWNLYSREGLPASPSGLMRGQ